MSIKKLGCAVMTILSMFTAGSGQAAVVVDGGAPNQVSAYYADAKFTPQSTAAATKFSLGSGVTFNTIQWWGTLYPTVTAADNNFTLQILSADLRTVLDTVNLGVSNGTTTGALISKEYDEIVYNASFSDTVLGPGDYFLSLSDKHLSQAAWAWETRTGGVPLGGATYGGGVWSFDLTENLAFQLSELPPETNPQVPEPHTLMLLAAGLIAWYALQRSNLSLLARFN